MWDEEIWEMKNKIRYGKDLGTVKRITIQIQL